MRDAGAESFQSSDGRRSVPRVSIVEVADHEVLIDGTIRWSAMTQIERATTTTGLDLPRRATGRRY